MARFNPFKKIGNFFTRVKDTIVNTFTGRKPKGIESPEIKAPRAPKPPPHSTPSVREKQARDLAEAQEAANKALTELENRFSDQPFKIAGVEGMDLGTVGDQPLTRKRFRYTRGIESFETDQMLYEYIDRIKNYTEQQFKLYDEIWRENTAQAIRETHGEAGRTLANWVAKMPVESFARIMTTTQVSIEYIYTPEERAEALAELHDIFEVPYEYEEPEDVSD